MILIINMIKRKILHHPISVITSFEQTQQTSKIKS